MLSVYIAKIWVHFTEWNAMNPDDTFIPDSWGITERWCSSPFHGLHRTCGLAQASSDRRNLGLNRGGGGAAYGSLGWENGGSDSTWEFWENGEISRVLVQLVTHTVTCLQTCHRHVMAWKGWEARIWVCRVSWCPETKDWRTRMRNRASTFDFSSFRLMRATKTTRSRPGQHWQGLGFGVRF